MIDLCRSRVAAVAAGAVSSGSLGSGIAQAWTVDLGNGSVQAEVRLDGVAQPATRITLDDCSTPPPQTRSLDVVIEGTGLGRVVSSPSGIDCAPDCQGVFEDSATVQLSALPDSGSTFDGWSGDCTGTTTPVQVTMTSDLACTANFSRPTADLAVTMSDTPDPVVAGESLALAVTARNAGPEPATNVRVRLTLPDGTTFTSASPDGLCFGNGTLATCSLGEIAAGGDVAFTVQAAVDPGQRTDLQALADISGQPVDPDRTDDQAITTTDVIAVADLSLSKQVAPDPGAAGGLVVFTMDVANAGPSTATGVTLQDTLPVGLTTLTGAQSLNCSTSPVPPGGTSQFKVVARVDAAVPTGSTLSNQASVSAAETDPDSVNNGASASLLVQAGTAPPSGDFVRVVESGAARPGGGVFEQFIRASQSGDITAFHHFDFRDPFSGTGHWLAVEGTQLLLADGSTPAPSDTGTFLTFNTDDPAMDGTSAVFSARIESGGWGVYRYDGCAIRRLFDDSVPEVFGAPRFVDQAGGTVVFVSGNDLYRWNGTAVETLVDESTALPSGNGNGLFTGVFTLAYDGGPIFFIATGGSLPPQPPVEVGVYAYSGGVVTPVATTDTAIPGGSGTFADFDSTGMTLSADGADVVFRGVDSTGARGLYARIDGSLRRIADADTPIPGGTGTFEYLGERFPSTSSVSEPSLSDGRVVFAGKNSDADASSIGIYVWEDGSIEPVLEPGDSAAGGIVQTAWLGRRGLDGTRVAILAQLAEPDNSFTEAILVTDVPTDVVFGDGFESATGF